MDNLTNPIFADADEARTYLEKTRWPSGPVCPHCGSTHERIAAVEGKKKSHRKGLYFCNSCQGQFTVTVGTVMEQSHIPLNKWLLGFYLMCASKKGYSAHQLHRTLKVSYKTAWFMAHRIREAMRSGGLAAPMGGAGGSGIVEVDETYIGRKKGAKVQRGGSHKSVVLSLVERDGEVRSFHVENATAKTILPIVEANVAKEARVMTDDSAVYYKKLGKFADHQAVNHSAKEYVRGEAHVNTLENYYSVFKRGMKGVYQHCGEQHLHRYVAEFDFRYNNRSGKGIEDGERTVKALRQIEGKRLTYRRTDEGQA